MYIVIDFSPNEISPIHLGGIMKYLMSFFFLVTKMELSKLNISSIAKEEIRRRFFDSRSAKNKTSDGLDSSDQKPDEDLKTSEKKMPDKDVEQTGVPGLEVETSSSEDDGFPLITSVFSLALPSSGTAHEGCGPTDKTCVSSDIIRNTAGTSQSMAYTTMPSSNDVPLPFVVNCSPNGVITVCSPPNPTSSSSKFSEDHKDSTTITSSLKGSVCSIVSSDITPASSDQQMFPDTRTNSLPSSTMGSNPNMITFIDATQQAVIPVEKHRSEVEKYLSTCKSETLNKDDAVCPTHTNQNQLQNPISCPQIALASIAKVQSSQEARKAQPLQTADTNLETTSVKTSSSVLPLNLADSTNERSSTITESSEAEKEQKNATDQNTLHHSDETATHAVSSNKEYIDQPVPTKQEEKIRQLKDLLRQKEAELEKFRFKDKTVSVSAAAQLRANFLKKNPSLCRRSQRLNTNEITASNNQISTPASSNKDKKLDKSDNELTYMEKISSETKSYASETKISDKADVKISSTSNKKSIKFTDKDKYKLVNVTILQGHTRTLAVPLKSENIATVYTTNNTQSRPSFCSKDTTRKRKQQMPRKVGPSPSKRKSNSEEDTATQTSPVKILNAVSSESSEPHCFKDTGPTGPNTRSSPRRREGHQLLKTIPAVKRKSPSSNELKTQNVSGAPTKVPKIISTSKTDPAQASSLVSLKAGPTLTKPKEICSTKIATTSNKSATTQPSAHLINCATAMTQSNITFNLKDTKQVTASNTTGKTVAYVLHMNGTGATTTVQTNSHPSGASNEEIVKRVVESMSKRVFAFVGRVPGDDTDCKGESKCSNSPITSPLPGTEVIPQRNLAAINNQSSQKSTPINLTSATNTSGNPSSTQIIPPVSCKVPDPMLSIPLLNFQNNKIRNESISSCQNNQVVQNLQSDTAISSHQLVVPLVKNITTDQPNTSAQNTIVSVTGNVTSTNTSPNLSLPVRLGVATSQMTSRGTGPASTVTVPIPATTANNQVQNTSNECLSSVSINPPASIVSKSRISTVATATNGQADSNNRTGNSSKPMTVNTIVPEVKSIPTALMTRTLAPKPKYSLTNLTVPIAIANSATNTNNVRASPTKINANTNPTSRPIAPKPTTLQYTSHRFLAPKPAPTLYTSPALISPKPETPQRTTLKPVAVKPTTTQCTSPKLLTPKPTSSQNIATKPATSEPFNQVINILPRPVMSVPTSSSTAFPENLNNGKIVVYDVVQSNLAQEGRNPPFASKDTAKLVVFVSNTGDTRNLGIIKDKKIYLGSNDVATVVNQPKVKAPVTTSTSEFIPNPQDADFKVLLGLEHVVKLLT